MKAAITLMTMLILTTVGCSTHYRSTDPQVSSDELMQLLGEATSQTQTLTSSGVDGNTLASDPNTNIYFAMAEEGFNTLGNVNTVLAFDNINFITSAVKIKDVTGARVFFLDNPGDGTTRQDLLIVGIQTDGSTYQYYSFSGNGVFDTGEFLFSFYGKDDLQYTLSSYDVDGDSLTSDIQLKLYQTDPAGGDDFYVGKFSVLAGFK